MRRYLERILPPQGVPGPKRFGNHCSIGPGYFLEEPIYSQLLSEAKSLRFRSLRGKSTRVDNLLVLTSRSENRFRSAGMAGSRN